MNEILEKTPKRKRGKPVGSKTEIKVFTEAQLRLIRLYISGVNRTVELTAELGISPDTVAYHLRKKHVRDEINRLQTLDLVGLMEARALQREIIDIAVKLKKIIGNSTSETAKVQVYKEYKKLIEEYADYFILATVIPLLKSLGQYATIQYV